MDADEIIGTKVGSYTIAAKLGQGGMGAVYLAEHLLLERKVAVKILLPELSSHKDSVDRFFHEARTTARLRHPAMVDVFDFGTLPDGRAFLIMDFLEGESLEARLRSRGALGVPEALRIARDVALGVSVAHAEHIVHRDLKPDNLFLLPPLPGSHDERVKILDFGIAKLGRQPADDGVRVTRAGALLGTPQYMSPEQCRGAGEVDARADIYSLGCILFAMLTGRPPFVAESMGELLGAHLLMPPPTLASLGVEVPEAVESLVQSLLSKEPDERPPSMVLVAEGLDELLDQVGAEPRRSARTQTYGAGDQVATKRGRPTPAPSPDAVTLASETLTGRSISETGRRPIPRRTWGALVMVGAAVVVVVVGIGFLISGERLGPAKQAPVSAGPAVERAIAPPPSRAQEQEQAQPPAPPTGDPALTAPVLAPPALSTPATTTSKTAARTRKGRPATTSATSATGARTKAADPPASQSPSTGKSGPPIYRGTPLQIDKNDPY